MSMADDALDAVLAEALACAESCKIVREEIAETLQAAAGGHPAIVQESLGEQPAAVASEMPVGGTGPAATKSALISLSDEVTAALQDASERSPPSSHPVSPDRQSEDDDDDEGSASLVDMNRVSRRTMTRRFVATALEAHWLESERCGRKLSAEAVSWLRRREAGQLAGSLRRDGSDQHMHWSASIAAGDTSCPSSRGTFLQQLALRSSPIEADQFEQTRARMIAERGDDVMVPARVAHTSHERGPLASAVASTTSAPELCADALDGIFRWLDETSLAMTMQVSRAWAVAARESLCWTALGARRWGRPAALGVYPRKVLCYSGGPGPVPGSSTWPSEWQAMSRTLALREPSAQPPLPYLVWLWGVRRIGPAKHRLADMQHKVACARSSLRKLDLAASAAPVNDPDVDRAGRDAGMIADAQQQVVDLEREVGYASEEVARLLGAEPPGDQLDRFRLIDLEVGFPTGQYRESTRRRRAWSRVTMLGSRVERYNSSMVRGSSAWMD